MLANTNDVYHLTIFILGIGIIIKCLELIAISKTFEPNYPNDWTIVGIDGMIMSRFAPFFEKIYSRKGMIILCLLSITSIILSSFVTNFPSLYNLFVVIIFICQLLIHHRQGFGGDGADQMSFLIILTMFFL